MQWGRSFADLCFKQKIKLVNYPVGVRPIGTPGGIAGSALLPVKNVREIVEMYVKYWRQEARELRAQAAKDQNGKSRNDGGVDGDDDDEDEVIVQDDLVRFVRWSQGKSSVIPLSTKR